MCPSVQNVTIYIYDAVVVVVAVAVVATARSLLDDLPPELRYSVFADLNLTLIHNIPFLTAAACADFA